MNLKKLATKAYNTLFRVLERKNLDGFDYTPQIDRPVYGVYHVYCDKDWQRMVSEQIAHLKNSGLLAVTSKLYISCIVKNRDEADELLKIADTEKSEIISITTDPSVFEYPALTFLHQKSRENDCFVYYFHTKGISYQSVGNTDKKFNHFKRNIVSWRQMMEYFLFDKWRVAINALSDGYDTYGCYRLPPPPKPYYLYAGNFWWSKSEYLRQLPDFSIAKLQEGRFYAEEWLYTCKPKDFSAFDCMADLYFVNMPHEIYASAHCPLFHGIAFVVKYNWYKFRKHVLHYDYNKAYKQRYQVLRNKEK